MPAYSGRTRPYIDLCGLCLLRRLKHDGGAATTAPVWHWADSRNRAVGDQFLYALADGHGATADVGLDIGQRESAMERADVTLDCLR